MKLKKWKRIARVGKMIYGKDFNTQCIGLSCESCSYNDCNAPGYSCAENCGWCHKAVTVYIDGYPCGQNYHSHKELD